MARPNIPTLPSSFNIPDSTNLLLLLSVAHTTISALRTSLPNNTRSSFKSIEYLSTAAYGFFPLMASSTTSVFSRPMSLTVAMCLARLCSSTRSKSISAKLPTPAFASSTAIWLPKLPKPTIRTRFSLNMSTSRIPLLLEYNSSRDGMNSEGIGSRFPSSSLL